MMDNRIDTCKFHIRNLEEKLTKIYTVELLHVAPADSLENVDVREELKKDVLSINVFSKLESKGIKQGETYDQYMAYLKSARYSSEEARKVINHIEQENAAEIKNINILLEAFKSELKLLMQ
jgi:hypothetical protein